MPFNPLYLAIPSDVVTVRVSGSPTLNIRDAKSNCSVSVVKYQNQKGAAVKIASDTPSSRENDVQVMLIATAPVAVRSVPLLIIPNCNSILLDITNVSNVLTNVYLILLQTLEQKGAILVEQ